MTQLKDGGRQPRNRDERSLSASTVIARQQGNGWDEPCKLRGLRTVLWAAGGEIPPADPAAWNPIATEPSIARQSGCESGSHLDCRAARQSRACLPDTAPATSFCRSWPLSDYAGSLTVKGAPLLRWGASTRQNPDLGMN